MSVYLHLKYWFVVLKITNTYVVSSGYRNWIVPGSDAAACVLLHLSVVRECIIGIYRFEFTACKS